jgi:hypothetical protein
MLSNARFISFKEPPPLLNKIGFPNFGILACNDVLSNFPEIFLFAGITKSARKSRLLKSNAAGMKSISLSFAYLISSAYCFFINFSTPLCSS